MGLPVSVDAASAGAVKTSYQVQLAENVQTTKGAVLEGDMPAAGAVEIPISKVSKSGSYKIKFTRAFADGTALSVMSQPFQITALDWEEVAGTYEALLEDQVGSGSSDGAKYRGAISLTVSRNGAVSGRLNYNEALEIIGAPQPDLRAYRPVSTALIGSFSATAADAPLRLTFTPTRRGTPVVERQTISADLDFSQSPPALTVTVVDFASKGTNSAAQPWVSGASKISKNLSKANPQCAKIAGRYVVSSDDSKAYFLVNATSTGAVLWTSRQPGYTGSGSGNLSLTEEVNARVVFYEGRASTSGNAINSMSLLGELNFVPDAGGITSLCHFGSSLSPSQLERQRTFISKRDNTYVYGASGQNETGVSALDFSWDQAVVWKNADPVKGFFLFRGQPMKLTLIDPLVDSQGVATQYSWDVSISDSGAVRANASSDSSSKAPLLTLKFDKVTGQLLGSYSPPRSPRRTVSLAPACSLGDSSRRFRGWAEAANSSGTPETGEARVDLNLP